MVTREETADLLERAADLYESEQVEWCSKSWGVERLYLWDSDEGRSRVQLGQFHCAEGAILRASGISMEEIAKLKSASARDEEVLSLLSGPEFLAATDAVAEYLGMERELNDTPRRIYNWNDSLARASAKRTLIDAFKNTAKELRNSV